MADGRPRETKDLDIYGGDALPWGRAVAALEQDGASGPGNTWFLGVTSPDGSPHAAGVGALWSEGGLYFTSGPGTRKSKALASRPAATLSARLTGIDLVFEGDVHRVTDRATLERIAARYREGGWPVEVDGEAFTAPYSAPQRRPAALVPLPIRLPHRVRRRGHGTVGRNPLAVRPAVALPGPGATPRPSGTATALPALRHWPSGTKVPSTAPGQCPMPGAPRGPQPSRTTPSSGV